MPKRHSDREPLEVILTTILLKYRPILFSGGCLLLVYAIAASLTSIVIAGIAAGFALLFFLMVMSDWFTMVIARFFAWLAMLGRK